MAISIHVGDVGTVFRLNIQDANGPEDHLGNKPPLDVSTATDMYILLESPVSLVKRLDAEFVTDGTDGEIQATTTAGTIDRAGTWRIQAQICFGATTFHSDKRNFNVIQALVYTS